MRLPTARRIHEIADVAASLGAILFFAAASFFVVAVGVVVLYVAAIHFFPGLLP